MGRPKKDPGVPAVRERIVEAFWDLLDQHPIDQITVAMVASHAGCTRGAFYYHFADLDSLFTCAIREEIYGKDGVASTVFRLITSIDGDLSAVVPQSSIRRISRAMRHGDMRAVEDTVKSLVTDMWRAVLRPDGGELAANTRLILEFAVGGVLALVTSLGGQERLGPIEVPTAYVRAMGTEALHGIARAQGIPEETIVMRLNMIDRLDRVAEKRQ